ncbi:hypothetical protein J6590_107587 [Homalodisca vitripennis]|nr:hypothetical protein J6590_107587 [Homalodisca vitripennis]
MLGGQSFRTDDALRDAVKTHLKSLAANFYEKGIKKLVPSVPNLATTAWQDIGGN